MRSKKCDEKKFSPLFNQQSTKECKVSYSYNVDKQWERAMQTNVESYSEALCCHNIGVGKQLEISLYGKSTENYKNRCN